MYDRISRLWELIVALIDSYDGFGARGSPTSSVNGDGNRARAVKPREIAGVSRFPENRTRLVAPAVERAGGLALQREIAMAAVRTR